MQTHSTPALSAVQFLPQAGQFLVARLIDREAVQDRAFAALLADAKRLADEDRARYEACIFQQAADLEADKVDGVLW